MARRGPSAVWSKAAMGEDERREDRFGRPLAVDQRLDGADLIGRRRLAPGHRLGHLEQGQVSGPPRVGAALVGGIVAGENRDFDQLEAIRIAVLIELVAQELHPPGDARIRVSGEPLEDPARLLRRPLAPQDHPDQQAERADHVPRRQGRRLLVDDPGEGDPRAAPVTVRQELRAAVDVRRRPAGIAHVAPAPRLTIARLGALADRHQQRRDHLVLAADARGGPRQRPADVRSARGPLRRSALSAPRSCTSLRRSSVLVSTTGSCSTR